MSQTNVSALNGLNKLSRTYKDLCSLTQPLPPWLPRDRGLCRPCARLLPLCSACGALCNLARHIYHQVAQEVRRAHAQRGEDVCNLNHRLNLSLCNRPIAFIQSLPFNASIGSGSDTLI